RVVFVETIRIVLFFFSSRRRHTRLVSDWSSDVCSSDLPLRAAAPHPGGGDGATGDGQKVSATASDSVLAWARRMRRAQTIDHGRSEERRVGEEGRARWARGD